MIWNINSIEYSKWSTFVGSSMDKNYYNCGGYLQHGRHNGQFDRDYQIEE